MTGVQAETWRKFTFSSVIHPSLLNLGNHAAKLPVEEAIYESGLVFTVLQPTMFMQTLLGGWKEVQQKSSFSLPYSKRAKACYVDYRDVAEAAAIAQVLEGVGWNRKAAANDLQISYKALLYKIKQYDLSPRNHASQG